MNTAFRFQQTSCSQCGREFGPGDHGFSHCDQHPGWKREQKLACEALIDDLREYTYGPGHMCSWMFDLSSEQAIERVQEFSSASKIARLTAALQQCEDYFDSRADVRDGDYGVPEPNTEMQMLSEIRDALGNRGY